MMEWFFSHYVPNGPRNDWRVSPLLGELSELPSALVVTAQFDPLHDEGQEYAKRLQAGGVPTQHLDVEGVVHEFFGLAGMVKPAKDTVDKIATWLKQVCGRAIQWIEPFTSFLWVCRSAQWAQRLPTLAFPNAHAAKANPLGSR